MKFEGPQPNPADNSEAKTPEQTSGIESELEKKESVSLDFEVIKNILISQIGSKAEINRLEIEEVDKGAKLIAEIDAGMMGGAISIEGYIVNEQDGLAVQDLNINARGYVKSRIESNLSSFDSAIKKHFEKQYRKSVSRVQIVGSSLVIDLENILESNESRESKTQIEYLLEVVDKIKDPWDRIANIENEVKNLVELKRYEDARKFAQLIKDEKSRNSAMNHIDKVDKTGI